VNVGGLRFGRLTDAERDRLLDRARRASVTYDHEGSTLDPDRWAAPEIHRHHIDVGTGRAAFDAAATALRTWVPHRGIGADVLPPGQTVELGATVLVILRWGPLFAVAPDRIVAVADEPRGSPSPTGLFPAIRSGARRATPPSCSTTARSESPSGCRPGRRRCLPGPSRPWSGGFRLRP
jgi:Domain of unknown function (DUF1990)